MNHLKSCSLIQCPQSTLCLLSCDYPSHIPVIAALASHNTSTTTVEHFDFNRNKAKFYLLNYGNTRVIPKFGPSCRRTFIDRSNNANCNVTACCFGYFMNRTPPFCPIQLSIGAAEVQPRNLLCTIFRGRLASANLPSVNSTGAKQSYIFIRI